MEVYFLLFNIKTLKNKKKLNSKLAESKRNSSKVPMMLFYKPSYKLEKLD